MSATLPTQSCRLKGYASEAVGKLGAEAGPPLTRAT